MEGRTARMHAECRLLRLRDVYTNTSKEATEPGKGMTLSFDLFDHAEMCMCNVM